MHHDLPDAPERVDLTVWLSLTGSVLDVAVRRQRWDTTEGGYVTDRIAVLGLPAFGSDLEGCVVQFVDYMAQDRLW